MNDIKFFASIFAAVVIIAVSIFMVVLAFLFLVEKPACEHYQELSGANAQYNWNFYTGCTVRLPNGMWTSTKNVKYINGEIQP